MRRPLETVLLWPRVRLTQKVPLIEAEELVTRYADEPEYQPILVKSATRVTEHSYFYFREDEAHLWNLLRAIVSNMYSVSLRTKLNLRRLLNDAYGDSLIFKEFDRKIEFLFDISKDLKDLTLKVEKIAESTKNYSIEIGEVLGIKLPSTSIDLQGRA
jgi:hypothetical protein